MGSSQCSFTTVNSPHILREFNLTASGIRPPSSPAFLPGLPLVPRELYFRNEHILCAQNALVGSICIFLQGEAVPVAGVPGFVITRRIRDLVDHGCKFCGSVPVSGDNRPFAAGVLTSNYVRKKGCQGVCGLGRKRVFWEGSGNWTFLDREARGGKGVGGASRVGSIEGPSPAEGGQQGEGGPYHYP
ncbi:MAG: hypothetical protein Q9184_002562 [Pyrenodesmia sp. 2 TL-2023]